MRYRITCLSESNYDSPAHGYMFVADDRVQEGSFAVWRRDGKDIYCMWEEGDYAMLAKFLLPGMMEVIGEFNRSKIELIQ